MPDDKLVVLENVLRFYVANSFYTSISSVVMNMLKGFGDRKKNALLCDRA